MPSATWAIFMRAWASLGEARAIVPKLVDRVAKDGLGRYEIALIYAGLGEKAQAVDWLEKALAAHRQGNDISQD